jgi:tetratricopeptide (TPR) repeat protein
MYSDAYYRVESNEYSAAIDILSELIEINSTYADAYILRAYAWEQGNSLDRARDDLLTAQKMDPDNQILHYNLGNVYFAQKELEKALEQYSISITINREHPLSYLNRANTYILLKMWKEALADYRIYISMSSEQKENILRVISLLEART